MAIDFKKKVEELRDKRYGKVGTPKRDLADKNVEIEKLNIKVEELELVLIKLKEGNMCSHFGDELIDAVLEK